ncbi:hypothetical protein O1D97_10620 [Marinomonas sp. 15G1-11]|uniref:Uncharacterized protein n=1 Tax=Marinomonas phaeophyticola TaxID=3004091 RepID=A0ABT4JVK2_9GAMM|nr:hypothetical protein [Marinomonas sp. 15G1-11]MCZ2722087.1 hypothetical protein [Marinomonas sp. 15G1-11]
MDTFPIETSLHHAMRSLQEVGNHINDLTQQLERLLSKHIQQSFQKALLRKALSWDYSDKENASHWFYESTYLSLPIIYSQYPQHTFHLSIQISLYGAGMCSGQIKNTAPLLHVHFGETPLNHENTFELKQVNNSGEDIYSFEDKILYWPPAIHGCPYQPWLFSTLLEELKSEDDLLIKVISPCLSLLQPPIKGSALVIATNVLDAFFSYSTRSR